MKTQLPIEEKEAEIISAVQQNQVVIIVGETGSGKTTQVPIMLHRAGFAKAGQIGVTQPRRLAVTAVAEYVGGLMKTSSKNPVGHKIRFEDMTSMDTEIKFLTNGVLLREIQSDPLLKKYSVIVIDEAHERTLEIDFLLGLLKRTLQARKEFKVLVMSATIDAQKFADYFSAGTDIPIIVVEGKMYPVEVRYIDWDPAAQEVVPAVVDMVLSIHASNAAGDVLVFMSGKGEIEKVCNELKKSRLMDIVILPLYSEIGHEDRKSLFKQYPGKRKIIVATNIAETSITIDGIVFVVDSGLIKQKLFNVETGLESLEVVYHSQAGCEQRKGRAGRTRPGICYRLYSKRNYHQDREALTSPEILRTNLSRMVLQMENTGIRHVERFEFIEPPDPKMIREAYQSLVILGAFDFRTKEMTQLGRKMAQLPLDPQIAKMLVEAARYRCVKSIAAFAAFQSVSKVFVRPQGKEAEADRAHARFNHPKSDALAMIYLWNKYLVSNRSRHWCHTNFLSANALEEISMVYEQLLTILEKNGVPIASTLNEEMIMKSIVSGLLYNLIQHDSRFRYRGIFHNTDEIYLHPSSSLHRAAAQFIVAMDLVQTTRLYARGCTVVPIEWVMEFLPQMFVRNPPVLKSYVKGEPHGMGEQAIMFRGKVVKRVQVKIAPEMAVKLGLQNDETMKKQHKAKLVFDEVDGNYVAKGDGFDIQLNRRETLIPVQAGIPYYCDIVYLGSIPFAVARQKAADLGTSSPKVTLPDVLEGKDLKSLIAELNSAWK